MIERLRLVVLGLIAGVFAASALAQPATAPAALARAVAETQARKAEYAFDYALDTSKQNWRARYEPSGARPHLHLIEPTRESLPQAQQRAFDRMAERMSGLSWCASANMGHARDVRLVREDADLATYAFQPSRESGGQAGRFADRLRGEFTLIKAGPDIGAIHIFAPQAFSPIPLTRLDQLDISIRCEPAPNGRRYAAETVSLLRGSAFGQDFNERSVQRAANVRAP